MSLTRDKAEKHAGKKQLIVILEGAFLETMKGKKGHELLNCDDHITFMKKMNKDFSEARPDITHQPCYSSSFLTVIQCLLTLLDSPLNKAGLLKVYIHTKKNVLIELNPQTRIPRTFKRFAGLMVQLLHEMKIRSTEKEGSKTLLKIVKNPVTAHLPVGCRRIGSTDAGEVVDLFNFVQTLPEEEPVVFVVGAYSKGEDVFDYVDQKICFSSYPLSASVACGKICTAFEKLWDVL